MRASLKSAVRNGFILVAALLPATGLHSAELKIASYNIEHMDEIIDESLSVRMRERCHATAKNIKALDPDILAIQEAPRKKEQMEFFVKAFLNNSYNVYFEPCKNLSLAPYTHQCCLYGRRGSYLRSLSRKSRI